MSDEMDQPEGEATYGLVMPFVTVASQGGPHDDAAYVCGWECGTLDLRLSMLAEIEGLHHRATVRVENLPQLDLIAMKHGYRMSRRSTDDLPEWAAVADEWALVDFHLAAYLDAEGPGCA